MQFNSKKQEKEFLADREKLQQIIERKETAIVEVRALFDIDKDDDRKDKVRAIRFNIFKEDAQKLLDNWGDENEMIKVIANSKSGRFMGDNYSVSNIKSIKILN